jgi:hypothetical protein
MNIVNSLLGYFGYGKQSPQLEEVARLNISARAHLYVEGHAPKQLIVKQGAVDDNVHVNYARLVLEKKVAFLFNDALKISIGAEGDTRGADYLEEVWNQEQRDIDFMDMATDGGTSGDVWLKIAIGADGSPRVVVGDPNCYTAETDPDDVSQVLTYRCEYQSKDASGRSVVFREETTPGADGESWQIQQYHSYDGGKSFSPVGDGVTWNFAFAPVFHAKNLPKSKSFYGRPDLTPDVLHLCDALSRVDSLCSKIVRIHASPKPYGRGLKKSDIEWGTDGMIFMGSGLGNVQAEIGLLEMKGDLSGALALRKVLREGLSEITGVPEVATGKLESTGQLSGVALQIMYSPLSDQTKVKQRLYGKLIKDVVSALMAIGGISGAVMLHWSNPLPVDERAQLDAMEAKKRIGFSENTVIKELGGDPVHEAKMRETERQDAQDAFNAGHSGAQLGTELLAA